MRPGRRTCLNRVRSRPLRTALPTSSASVCSASSKIWSYGKTRRTKRCCRRRATRSGRAGAAPALKTPVIRAQRSCSTATSCRPFTILSPGAVALPLEAQRLGLEAYASDLNPVAVLINKAMIEIPPKFAGDRR